MAINYERVGWDTSNFVNPTNMNQMDKGIKDACDGVDGLKERIGVADISEIGDGTVKGAMAELSKIANFTSTVACGILPGDANLNNYTTGGRFIGAAYPSNMSNLPSKISSLGATACAFELKVGVVNEKYMQELTTVNNSSPKLYKHYRAFSDGVFGEWMEVANADDFLPLTGGTLSGNTRLEKSTPAFTLKNTDNDIEAQMYVDSNKNVYFRSIESGSYSGFKILPYTTQGNNLFKACASNGEWYLFGEHNKPSGSYTGNGSAERRAINTGGIGSLLLIRLGGSFTLVTNVGAVQFNANGAIFYSADKILFTNGKLIMTTDELCNTNGYSYDYQVL